MSESPVIKVEEFPGTGPFEDEVKIVDARCAATVVFWSFRVPPTARAGTSTVAISGPVWESRCSIIAPPVPPLATLASKAEGLSWPKSTPATLM